MVKTHSKEKAEATTSFQKRSGERKKLKTLLERYTKILEYPFDDAIQQLIGTYGEKCFEAPSLDIIDWMNFAVFLNAWNLNSHEFNFPNMDNSGLGTWNFVNLLLKKYVMATIESAGPILSSPGNNLSILVQMESLSHTRSQLLLMDPLPDVTKAFSLVSQEETQRAVQSILLPHDNNNSMAFATKSAPIFTSPRPMSTNPSFQSNTFRPPLQSPYNTFRPPSRPPFNPNRPNIPYCTHCQMPGHTINTCFKIHGFPPGYRPPNPRFPNQPTTKINNLSSDTQYSTPSVQNLLQHMTPEQYSQLSQLFSHDTNNPQQPQHPSTTTASHSCTINAQSGPDIFEEDWQGQTTKFSVLQRKALSTNDFAYDQTTQLMDLALYDMILSCASSLKIFSYVFYLYSQILNFCPLKVGRNLQSSSSGPDTRNGSLQLLHCTLCCTDVYFMSVAFNALSSQLVPVDKLPDYLHSAGGTTLLMITLLITRLMASRLIQERTHLS
ncbi:hypothetical protein RD792_014092 [Penstemon davidsonii]|uniref:Uncharacterized protein n=1 Tax=Penstemon davidsonii TaxID=160366 RepID=A0ABR0CP79_9LAMI|nr:hypothetical protein RD792_014092 [Penstemon davidsonii]